MEYNQLALTTDHDVLGRAAKVLRMVRIDTLQPADSPRLAGVQDKHVELLAASDVHFPPILVHRSTMRVIDGMHRVHVARLRNAKYIQTHLIDGEDDLVFVLAVQANMRHGLPLTLADRRSAANRILDTHPAWSDRAIAAVTGLAARTVANLRTTLPGTGPLVRTGLDGRTRSVDSERGRLAARAALREQPDLTVRQLAHAAGISLSTALDVRRRLKAEQEPALQQAVATPGHTGTRRRERTPAPDNLDPQVLLAGLKRDPLLRFTESGRRLLRWLLARVTGLDQAHTHLPHLPPEVRQAVAELAQLCATEWLHFAEQLDEHAASSERQTRSSEQQPKTGQLRIVGT